MDIEYEITKLQSKLTKWETSTGSVIGPSKCAEVFSREDQKILLYAIQKKDELSLRDHKWCADMFVWSYYHMVTSIVQKLLKSLGSSNPVAAKQDLIQEGVSLLLERVDKFHDKSGDYGSWVYPYLTHQLTDHLVGDTMPKVWKTVRNAAMSCLEDGVAYDQLSDAIESRFVTSYLDMGHSVDYAYRAMKKSGLSQALERLPDIINNREISIDADKNNSLGLKAKEAHELSWILQIEKEDAEKGTHFLKAKLESPHAQFCYSGAVLGQIVDLRDSTSTHDDIMQSLLLSVV